MDQRRKEVAVGVMFVLFGVAFAVWFLIENVWLGHGEGSSGKVFTFIGGWLSGGFICGPWGLIMQRRAPERSGGNK